MPAEAAVAKVAAVQGYGGMVTLGGDSVDECVAAARARAEETGAVFVHPFDDPEVIAGQATLGLELLEQVARPREGDRPDRRRRPRVRGRRGAQARAARGRGDRRPDRGLRAVPGGARRRRARSPSTRPRRSPTASPSSARALTLPLIERWVDEVVVVSEEDTAEAMVLLMERAKLVVEGAGAVGVAALTAGLTRPAATGSTVVVLSGGNVDAGLLALLARRHETAVGRRLRVFTVVADRPGGLAALLHDDRRSAGANLLAVEHVREAVDLQVRQTGIELTLETRGAEHAEAILAAMAAAGYAAERV